MKIQIELRDTSRVRDTVTGHSRDNMIRRMFGSTARGINVRMGAPLTIVNNQGQVLGQAIFYEV